MGCRDDTGETNDPCWHDCLLIRRCKSFITFMDALKLNLKAKDQLHPFLTELMTSYSRFKGSQEWEGRGKILHWCVFPFTHIRTVTLISLS